MGGYQLKAREIEKRLNELRIYLRRTAGKLSYEEEGRLLDEVDALKRDLECAREIEGKPRGPVYSPHVLEMKTKFPGPGK